MVLQLKHSRDLQFTVSGNLPGMHHHFWGNPRKTMSSWLMQSRVIASMYIVINI